MNRDDEFYVWYILTEFSTFYSNIWYYLEDWLLAAVKILSLLFTKPVSCVGSIQAKKFDGTLENH